MGCCLPKNTPLSIVMTELPQMKTPCPELNTDKSCFFLDGRGYLWKMRQENHPEEALEMYQNNLSVHNIPDHPHILKPKTVLKINNTVVTCMEFGKDDLFNIVVKPFDAKMVMDGLFHLAGAIHFLHDNNIAHRDIKPENIVLFEKRLHLIDWDFCYPLNERQHCGTPHFKCPESVSSQWNCSGRSFSRKSDVYSFGKTIFAILWRASMHNMISEKRFVFDAFHCSCLTSKECPDGIGEWHNWVKIAILCISNNPPECIPIELATISAPNTGAQISEIEVVDADTAFA